jgi:hypothetical protein
MNIIKTITTIGVLGFALVGGVQAREAGEPDSAPTPAIPATPADPKEDVVPRRTGVSRAAMARGLSARSAPAFPACEFVKRHPATLEAG